MKRLVRGRNDWLKAAALSFLVVAAGCKEPDGAQHLPPAIGSGAPPLPAPPANIVSLNGGAANAAQDLVASGTTRARKEAELSAKVGGTLQTVTVNEGDRVKKGQVLFTVDSAGAAIELKQAQARVASARVVLSGAELEYNRTRELAGENAVSAAALDNAKLALEQARAGLQQAEASVSAAQKSAGDTVVRSPIDGVVAKKLKQVGESVSANGSPVLLVQDLGAIEVRVQLPETELRRVRAGAPMSVKIRAMGKNYASKIDRINPSVDDATRTIEVVGMLDNASGEIKAGLLVEVTFPEASPNTTPPSQASAAASDSPPAQVRKP